MKKFIPEPEGNPHADDLVKQIVQLNHGRYLDDELRNTRSMNFCIGVAGYPEKHIESPNLESDLHFLKKKIESGAHYIVTQMFFDNSKYFEFVKRCRAEGITVPIIAGLKPLSTREQIVSVPKTFNVDIPAELVKEVLKCNSNKEVRELGTEWAIAQSKELIEANVPVLHFYTMGKSDNIQKIAKAVF
jgi:methylenetetrahydrofolate reductase (NADPH)